VKHLLRAGKFLAPYKGQALIAFLALLLSNGASLIQPQFTRLIVDRGIEAADMRLIILLSLGLVGFSILNSVFNFAQGALMVRTAQDVAYDMRNRIYAKIQALSFSYHDHAQTGQLMTRATSDVDLVQGFLGQGFLMVVGSALMMIGSLIFLFITNWQLSIVMLVIVPISFGIFGNLNRRIRPMFRVVQQRLSHLNTVLQESLVGVRVVKAFVREPHEAERFEHANLELYDINIRIARMVSFLFPLIFLFSNTATLAVYWIGGGQVIRGQLSLGEMISFINYMMMAFWPMMTVTMVITMISQASASAERIFEVLDARSEVVEKPDAVPLPPVQGRVIFEDVSFRYIEHGEPVLSEVSFAAEPGQVVALLGATGSGKSTIINLIPRFYDVTEGRVLIDSIDVRDVTIESLRSQIGIVFQETTLFAGTVKENIAFGRPEATMDEIVAAAKAAEAHDFIVSFPDGYETQVGERGMTLSGGQKQRVAIARALVLDPETEYRIQQALDRLMEGRTSFVIAQRIATVLNADQILVLERGEIAARGVHEELMATSEIYAEIYHSQLLQDTDLSAEDIATGPVAAPAGVGGGQFSMMRRAEGMRPGGSGPGGGSPRRGAGASPMPPRREIE
jgi:ATP-binding cassette subfamily B multidrug efflux pump